MSQLVYVYGSLKRGYALHSLLAHSTFVGTAMTEPLYRLFDLGHYPGLVEWPAGLAVHGELYDVDEATLVELDAAEGVAEELYVRREIRLQQPPSERQVHAWFWLGRVRNATDCGDHWPASAPRPHLPQ